MLGEVDASRSVTSHLWICDRSSKKLPQLCLRFGIVTMELLLAGPNMTFI